MSIIRFFKCFSLLLFGYPKVAVIYTLLCDLRKQGGYSENPEPLPALQQHPHTPGDTLSTRLNITAAASPKPRRRGAL